MGQSSPERGMQSWYGLQPLSRSSNWMDMERGLELDGAEERISLLKLSKNAKILIWRKFEKLNKYTYKLPFFHQSPWILNYNTI